MPQALSKLARSKKTISIVLSNQITKFKFSMYNEKEWSKSSSTLMIDNTHPIRYVGKALSTFN